MIVKNSFLCSSGLQLPTDQLVHYQSFMDHIDSSSEKGITLHHYV